MNKQSLQSPQAQSPTKAAGINAQFGFGFAIEELNLGKKVTKLEWDNSEYFLEVRNSHLQIHKPDGKYYDLIVTDGDMLGTDWITI